MTTDYTDFRNKRTKISDKKEIGFKVPGSGLKAFNPEPGTKSKRSR
jgi:hypothetical protein